MQNNLYPTVFFVMLFCICSSTRIFGQDTLNKATPVSAATPVVPLESIKNPIPPSPRIDGDTSDTGVAVSPSTIRFNAKPGTTQTKTIKVTNDTRRNYNFQINFQDYGVGENGKQDVAVKTEYRNALSKYLVTSPTLLELKPHESKTISVTIDIPHGDSMAHAMWTTLIIDQVFDRQKLEIPNANENTLGLGVNTGMGFGVNVFQNPPNVVVNQVEIKSMLFEKAIAKAGNAIIMKAKNTGDGLGSCLYYIELTNLLTGKQSKMKVKQFNILPGYEKEFRFDLPLELEKGKYSAMAVLDFGNKDELQTAELEFTLE